jgi:hypothetical protein
MIVAAEGQSTENRSNRRKNSPNASRLTTNPTCTERTDCDETRVKTVGRHV